MANVQQFIYFVPLTVYTKTSFQNAIEVKNIVSNLISNSAKLLCGNFMGFLSCRQCQIDLFEGMTDCMP